MLEATNLATGRGTDTPFERVGAPWIDPAAVRRGPQRREGAGDPIRARSTSPRRSVSTPASAAGASIIIVTDWSRFDPIRLGITLAVQLRKLYPDEWKPEGLLRLLADRATYQDILAGKPVDAILAGWAKPLAGFRAIRERYLLYRDELMDCDSCHRTRADRSGILADAGRTWATA